MIQGCKKKTISKLDCGVLEFGPPTLSEHFSEHSASLPEKTVPSSAALGTQGIPLLMAECPFSCPVWFGQSSRDVSASLQAQLGMQTSSWILQRLWDAREGKQAQANPFSPERDYTIVALF